MTIYIPLRPLLYTQYIRTTINWDIYWNENPRYKHFLSLRYFHK